MSACETLERFCGYLSVACEGAFVMAVAAALMSAFA
jgi:hypothetical protein